MPSVKAFYEALSSARKDVFTALAADLQSSSREEKQRRLKEFLEELKREIDEINSRRKALGDMLDNVKVIRLEADRALDPKQGGKAELELELFRNALLQLEHDLKDEIAELRPDRKLEKKYDVARRIEGLLCRAALSERLQVEVFGKKPNPLVNGSDVATKHAEMAARRGESTPEVERTVQDVLAGKTTGVGANPGFPQAPLPGPGMSCEDVGDE